MDKKEMMWLIKLALRDISYLLPNNEDEEIAFNEAKRNLNKVIDALEKD